MKNKWGRVIAAAVVLMIVPFYSLAAPDLSTTSQETSSSNFRYVPVSVFNSKLGDTSWNTTRGQRNVIYEVARLEETEDEGYKVSLKIGSFSSLDLVQVIEPEKTEEVLDVGISNIPLGTYNLPENIELPSGVVPSEEANIYYLPETLVSIDSYDTQYDTGLISFEISDLEKDLIIRTYSEKNTYNVMDQVIELDIANIFSLPEITENEVVLNSQWMGATNSSSSTYTHATRIGKQTPGTYTVDKAFSKDVKVKKLANGKIQAVLDIDFLEGESDEIKKIEIASKRPPTPPEDDTSVSGTDRFWLNEYWADYEEAEISEEKLYLTFDSAEQLAMGTAFQITTAAEETKNATASKQSSLKYRFATLYIKPDTGNNTQQTKSFTLSNGCNVRISYWSNDLPVGSTIEVKEGNGNFIESTLQSYREFARDSMLLTFTILDENGNETYTQLPVTYTVEIPDNWNEDRLFRIVSHSSGVAPSKPGNDFDPTSRTVTESGTTPKDLNISYLIYDAGEAEDVTSLVDGIYQAKVTIASKTDPLQTSMANEAFSSRPAYLEVSNGKVSLYAETGGVNFGGQFGYISNMFMGNVDSDDKQEVTYLGYQTENDIPIWYTDNATYSAHCVKKIYTELTNPIADGNYVNAFEVAFWVPIMDGIVGGNPGSGEGAQPAYLRISNIESVEDNVNPLSKYEKSVAQVEIDNAQYYLSTHVLSENKRSYINYSIEAAELEINQWDETNITSENINNICNSLQTSVNAIALEDGYYYVPFLTESGLDDLNDAFVVIKDSNMTITLEKKDGSTISNVEYHGEYGDFMSDVEYSKNGTTATFTLPYSERALLLRVEGEEYLLALNYEEAVLFSTDMSNLKDLLNKANTILEDEIQYTTISVKSLKSEIEKSEELLTNLDAEQSEVDVQTELLRQAIDGLKEKASDDQLTELSRLKREIAAAINNATYTSASRAELKDFYDELTGSTADTDNISTEDYEQYVLSIEAAMAALVEDTEDPDDNPDGDSDNQVISLVEDYRSWLDETDFTDDSWAAFSEVLDAAEALGQSDLTETEVQKEIDKILEARNGLIYRTDYEGQIDELADYLDEVEAEMESQGFPGYIGYDSLASAIAAADYGVERTSYLSQVQITALADSVTFHYDALLEEDNPEEAVNSIMLHENYIPEVILEEDLLETEAGLEGAGASGATGGKTEATEESTEAAKESTEAAKESTEAAEESTEAAKESTEAAEESTEAAEENTDTTEETSGSAEESSGTDEENESSSGQEDEETSSEDSRKEEDSVQGKEPEEEGNTSEGSSGSTEGSESDSDEQEEDTGNEDVTEKEEEEEEKTDQSSQPMAAAAISPHIVYRVTAAANRSGDYEDGTYYVDYDLWKWDDDSLSMGNAALDYGDQLGRMILDDGIWTLYIHLNQLQYDGIVGELKAMKRMVNIKNTSDGLSYGTRNADYPKTIENYPSVLGFTISESDEYIPIEVNVPLMTAGPIQVARLIVDWDSLDYINGSTDINSSMDLNAIEDAMDEAEDLDSSDYTSWSWKVVEDSFTAAENMIQNEWATQAMLDKRTEALEAAMDALVPVARSADRLRLSDALLEAYIIDSADYSDNALLEIERAKEAAEALENADDVTSAMIDVAVRDLEAALKRSGTGGGDDSDDSDDSTTVRYTTLQSLVALLEGYDGSQYTSSSWKNLQTALNSAKEVLASAKKGKATQEEVDDQVQLLKDARSELVSASGNGGSGGSQVNYKYLNSLVLRARNLLSMTSSYTEASLRNLQTEYDLALVMLEDENATQEEVDEQKENLRSAINSLVASSGTTTDTTTDTTETDDDTDNSGSNEDEGYYEVDVDL